MPLFSAATSEAFSPIASLRSDAVFLVELAFCRSYGSSLTML